MVDPEWVNVPRVRGGYAWVFATLAAVGFGYFEGFIYHHPPRVPLVVHWSVLAILVSTVLVGYLGLARGFIFLPYAAVVQDAFSLFGQGDSPVGADWYRIYFGDNVMTASAFGIPNWYLVFASVTILADFAYARVSAAFALNEASRWRRAPHRSRK